MRKKTAIIFIALALVGIASALLIRGLINRDKRRSFDPIGDSVYYAYQVEDAGIDGNDVVIKGWFFELQKVHNLEHNVDFADSSGLVIYDLNDGSAGVGRIKKGIAADVTFADRTDINEYFRCEYDYSHCGFEARVKKSKLDFENGRYQIIIKPDEMELRGIQAAYIVNGKITFTNPFEGMELNVQGTDLETIVNDGTCLMSYPDAHICVYQYERKLYWIAGKDFNFEKDGSTSIGYQAETTQFYKLPVNKRYNPVDMTESFESREITDSMDCGEYRVSVRDLPSECSPTQMGTGYRVGDKWVWKRFFRPDYRFLTNGK